MTLGMIFSKGAVDSGYYCFLFEAARTEIRASRALAVFGLAASRLSTAHKPRRSKLRDICCALQFVLTARRVPCEGLRIAPAAEASEQVPICRYVR